MQEKTVTIMWEQFRALLKIAGQQIDPATAEVKWEYALTGACTRHKRLGGFW